MRSIDDKKAFLLEIGKHTIVQKTNSVFGDKMEYDRASNFEICDFPGEMSALSMLYTLFKSEYWWKKNKPLHFKIQIA